VPLGACTGIVMHCVRVLRHCFSFTAALSRVWQQVATVIDLSNELQTQRLAEPAFNTTGPRPQPLVRRFPLRDGPFAVEFTSSCHGARGLGYRLEAFLSRRYKQGIGH
jgi:hypothetical protein